MITYFQYSILLQQFKGSKQTLNKCHVPANSNKRDEKKIETTIRKLV